MYKSSSSRVIPIIIVLIVIAIAIAAIVSIGRAVFGGGSTTTTNQVDVGQTALLDTASNRSVRMTVRGPIVADENFRSYQIIVGPSSRSLTTYSGYLGTVLETKSLGNNVKAYDEFVHALDKANMTNGTVLEEEADDIRGICATGNVYEFDVMVDNTQVKHLWTSTCKGSKGSFRASVPQVQSLFLSQVPEASAQIGKIDL